MLLVLQPGGQKDLLFHMQPAGVIVGKITDTEGDPVPGVWVVARPLRARTDRPHGMMTDDLGEYRIGGLPPGRYTIAAEPRGELQGVHVRNDRGSIPVTTYFPGTPLRKQAIFFEVSAGNESPANLTLSTARLFRIRGEVSQLPARFDSADIILRPLDEDEDLNIGIDPWPIDKTGGFEIGNVPPGSYAVFLGAGQELMRTDPVIEVDDADVEGVRVTPLANGNIRGRFRMETDRIIDWTQFYVALVPAHWRPIASGTWGGRRYSMLPDEIPPRANVRSNGSFELKEVPAGSYRLSVTDGDEALPDYFVKAVNIGGQDVIESGFTTAGQQSLDVVVSAKGAAIDGVVLDDKDQPSGDVNVIVFPDEKRRGRSDLYHLVSTDAKGHFHLRGLSPGEYRIFALDEDVNGDEISDPDFVGSHEGLGRSITAVEGETESIVLKLGSASE